MNFKRLLLTLYRLEEGQQDILARLDRLESARQADDGKWLQCGIDNILSYSAGRKNGEET